MSTENLLKLADYLERFPADYQHFAMDYYVQSPICAETCNDCARRLKLKACGTAACAVGHGPNAGILPLGNEGWLDYSERAFGLSGGSREWLWCFSEEWESVDNTPSGAAKRIRALVDGRMDDVFPWESEEA